MTVVLIHGNPETPRSGTHWSLLSASVRSCAPVATRLGAPVPPGFLTTAPRYRDWLTDELEELGVPVDLVGHDWGGAHVVNVAMTRPDLLRSWCTDSVGLFDLDYTWHALARTWQTAWVGEKAVAELTAPTARQRAASLASIGVPADIASARARGCADVSGPAVLALYRTPRNNPQWPTSAATCPPQRSAPAWSCSPRTTLPLAPKRCAGVPPRELARQSRSCPASVTGGCCRTPTSPPDCFVAFVLPAVMIGQHEIALLRLVAQRIAGPGLATAAETVRWLTAAQAQDHAGVLTSIALRTAFGTRADVEAALNAGEVVKSWPMRGTLHLVAAEDLRWMLSVAAPRVVVGAATRRAQLRLDAPTLERAREHATDALRGGQHLRRADCSASGPPLALTQSARAPPTCCVTWPRPAQSVSAPSAT